MLTIVSFLVVLLVLNTHYIDTSDTDTFYGTLHTVCFFMFVFIMTISPAIFQRFGVSEPDYVLNFKQFTELAYRVLVFSVIASIYFTGNDK